MKQDLMERRRLANQTKEGSDVKVEIYSAGLRTDPIPKSSRSK